MLDTQPEVAPKINILRRSLEVASAQNIIDKVSDAVDGPAINFRKDFDVRENMYFLLVSRGLIRTIYEEIYDGKSKQPVQDLNRKVLEYKEILDKSRKEVSCKAGSITIKGHPKNTDNPKYVILNMLDGEESFKDLVQERQGLRTHLLERQDLLLSRSESQRPPNVILARTMSWGKAMYVKRAVNESRAILGDDIVLEEAHTRSIPVLEK